MTSRKYFKHYQFFLFNWKLLGIACDPNKRHLEDQEEDNDEPENRPGLQDNGAYIDYQENQMVLANGQRIALNSAGKNKARRPNYRQ